jgi:hypothetical protein
VGVLVYIILTLMTQSATALDKWEFNVFLITSASNENQMVGDVPAIITR